MGEEFDSGEVARIFKAMAQAAPGAALSSVSQSPAPASRWSLADRWIISRFHRTVARAAGNPILATLMETITANLYEHRSKTVANAVDLKEAAEMHREIYRAIRTHNPAKARQAMEQHLNLARAAQATEPKAAADPTSAPAETTTQ